ncbi:hypothetical protein [Saccharothrix lopnurensis]|uniref:Secreted protein n=1 Tax=Saccharothrix lopnurensis TaxID=1670621 RepID=A0ABW1PD11_9PSEU
MIRKLLRRAGTTLAATALAAAALAVGASAAEAGAGDRVRSAGQDVGVTRVHRAWACDIPAGHTYSSVRINTRCAWRYEYYLLDAVNYNLTGTYACSIPSGYTYTASQLGNNCSTSGSSYEYRLLRL